MFPRKEKAEDEKQTFSMYYDYNEPIKRIANHRVLAMNRGEKEKVLSIKIDFDTTRIQREIANVEIKLKMRQLRLLKRLFRIVLSD